MSPWQQFLHTNPSPATRPYHRQRWKQILSQLVRTMRGIGTRAGGRLAGWLVMVVKSAHLYATEFDYLREVLAARA